MARQWPGLGQRIKDRIAALGYANPAQFADAHGYRVTYVYKWISGTTPDRDNLDRLAVDLETSPAWLLFGEDEGRIPRGAKAILAALALGAVALLGYTGPALAAPGPTRAGWVPAKAGTLANVVTYDPMSVIRRWLYRWVSALRRGRPVFA